MTSVPDGEPRDNDRPRQDDPRDDLQSVTLAAQHRTARRQGASVAVASGVYGLSFGALAVTAGLSVPQTVVLSLLMFTGGSQFAFVGVVGAGGSAAAAVAAAGLLGVRNGVYGTLVAPVLQVTGWRRAAAVQLTIDESTAVATAQTTPAAGRTGFWWAGVGVYLVWNTCVALGALAGDRLGDPRRYGLDAAAAAAFLALVWPRLRAGDTRTRLLALAAAGLALVATPVLSPGLPILVTAVLAVGVGLTGGRGRPHPAGAAR